MKKISIAALMAVFLAITGFGSAAQAQRANKDRALVVKSCISAFVVGVGKERIKPRFRKNKRLRRWYLKSKRQLARQKGLLRWRNKVRRQYGLRYAAYSLAKRKRTVCIRNRSRFVCKVRAKPCTIAGARKKNKK